MVSKEITPESLVGVIYTVAARDNKYGAAMINFNILGVVLLAGYFVGEDPKKVGEWFATKPPYNYSLDDDEDELEQKEEQEEVEKPKVAKKNKSPKKVVIKTEEDSD